ncbi:MAG: alpha-1,2-mannosidase [Candidatus Eremiobacter antarcticus]|nr:MAG: alpha-1,2-mannosidase [Candidatus Eremiobacter sp. RRmetagenome_bin22]
MKRPVQRLGPVVAACLLLLTSFACGRPAAAAAGPEDLNGFVNPLVGTSGNGYDGAIDTFPGADAPFGMVQWSPDTPSRPAGGGYNYNDSSITGFSLTHLSGPGCSVFGDIGVLPTIGEVADPANAVQAFSHASEVAEPGYYEVMVGMPGIRTRLSATTRTGVASFTFPSVRQANLLINPSSNQAGVSGAELRTIGNDEIEGSATSGWFCGMPGKYTVFYVLRFDRPFLMHGTWLAKHLFRGSSEATGIGSGGWITFDTTANPTVNVQAALSWVSVDGARANLRAEAKTWNIDVARAVVRRQWANELARVRIQASTPVQERVFYTALYHTLLHPNVYSDADGSYRGFDGSIHRVESGHTEYANFSGWDIYRTEIPLLALLEPHRTADMMRSLLHASEQSGWLPKWSLVNVETAVMGGDPSDAMLATAYAFGVRDFDAREALRAMVKGATQTGGEPGQGWYYQRPGLDEYLSRGYVVNDHATNVAPLANGASLTLEYSLADFSIGQLAHALGDERTARTMYARSQSWTNLFDRSTGLIAPRDDDGAFQPAALSENGQSGFQEGTAAQYTWMVPHAYAALIRGMGGANKASASLDAFFAQMDAGQDKPFAWMGNEPSIGSPWAYLSTGEPWKAQRLIRAVLTQLWGDTPDGIPGNDDLGTMSAWYVWCALGLYPQYPAAPILDLGAPLVRRASIRVPNGAHIDILAPQASETNGYVQSVKLNGKRWPRSWVRYSARPPLRLEFVVSYAPQPRWASRPQDAPPSFDVPPLRFPASTTATIVAPSPTRLRLAPGAAAPLHFAVQNSASAPASVTWSVDAPEELTVAPLGGRADAPPAAAHTIPLRVAVSPHAAAGLYNFSISGVSDENALLASVPGYVQVTIAGQAPALGFVANLFDATVTPFDLRTHATGPPITVGQFPRDLALSPNRKRLYVADNASNELSVVDAASQAVITTVAVGKGPWAVAVSPDSAAAWVTNATDNTVQAIDAATLRARDPIPVGTDPQALAISPDGKQLYVANTGSGDVTVVNTKTSAVSEPIAAGARPRAITVSPDGKTLYVSNFGADSVTPIDVLTRTAGRSIAVGVAPRGLAISPDGKWLYVANFGSNSVTPIDLASRTPQPAVAVGLNPVSVAFDETGSTAFVVNAGDNDCVPIDVRTRRIGAAIRLGNRPIGLAR